jgi:gliding motility-associated-like protein
MRKNLLLLFVLSFFSFAGFAQDFSNKGKDFWVGYGYHQVMQAGNTQDMVLYFATDQLTTVTVEIPGIAYSQTFPNIPANTIFTTPVMPKGTPDARLLTDGLQNKGIHVTSTKSIVAYAHIYNSAVSGACVLLPTNTLGKEYYSINYTNNSNTTNANSWFYVVAADTGTTTIEITPSANTVGGWLAGSVNTVNLTQGQIYNVMGQLNVQTGCGQNGQPPCSGVDLTGSKIRSIASGSGGCKKIAVYSGSGRISLTCNNTPSSSDNYMVQAFPKSAWGKRFLTATTGGGMTRNIYRVCVADPATVVKINGAVTALPLINNFYYEIPFTNAPQKIEGDLPITVAQYVPSQNACSNGNPGDPEVIYLSPVEQSISKVLFNSNLLVAAGPTHFVNVIVPNGGTAISSFRRDGAVVPPASFTVHPQDAAYSFIKIAGLNLGQHTLESDSGFNAIAYGFANAESYGYNAGTNVRDFNRNLEIQSEFGIINDGTANSCTNSPFKFKIYLPDSAFSNSGPTAGTNVLVRYDSMKWEVTNATAFIPNNFPRLIPGTTAYPPTYLSPNKVFVDSVTTRNGKRVSWYSLNTNYAITTPGIYTINVTGYLTNATSDGCTTGNEIDYEFTLNVSAPPPPTFTYNQPGCPADSVRFLETTPQGPIPSVYPTYKFWWNFGDPASGVANDTSIVRNPVHKFSAPGTYTVRFANITTPGCKSDTISQQIVVPNLVTATISGTATVCQNTIPAPPIIFTITPGIAPYRIKYTLSTNGGAPLAQPDIITSTLVNTILAPTGVAGTFVYSITSVENANATYCTVPIIGQTATVIIRPLPTATITGATTVCQNTPQPTITFTGANATAPYTFTYKINAAGALQTITTTVGNSITLNAPTNVIGTFDYILVSVRDASSTLCNQLQPDTARVVIQATSTATISGTSSVCQDATAPIITFTGANGTAPFTFTYNINGGATQTIVSLATSNSVTLTVPMTTPGTFVYNLLSVRNTGPINCTTPITGASATVVINPLPTATITGTTTVCQVAGSQTLVLTGAGGTRPYTFTYSINGVTQPTVVSDPGVDTKSIIVPVTAVNTFTYKIISVRDASSTLCITNYPLATQPTAVVGVQATSTATIVGTTTLCQNNAAPIVTFTAANGIAPFTFTYNINGGATQTVVTTATSNSVTVPVSMAATGTFVYNLLSVRNTGTINCTTPITGASATVIINPVPTATISGTTTVCQNTIAPVITFTAANGTAPYTFNYTLNSVPQTITTTVGNSVTLNAPTGTFGVFTYVLTSVKDASATICTQTQTGSAVVTVKQLATATIAANVPTVCQNSTTLPTITFTATGGVAPYTFTYKINGGANLTTSTITGNTRTITVPTATAGTYIYTLVSVQESSVGGICVNPQIGSAQVIVHPQPTASFTTLAPYCALKDVTFTPTGTVSSGTITSWVWNYDNGTGANVRTDQLPFVINYPTAGVKNVTYKTISDKGCESVLFAAPVTINSKPKAGFISPESCLADAFAQFTDTSTVVGGTIANWEWNFGDPGSPTNIISGSGPTFQNPQHAYATVGLKTVRLIVTSNSGCKDTVAAQSFFINGEVTSADFITQTPAALCSNRPVFIRENSVVNVGGLIRVEIYWDNANFPLIKETDELPTPGKIYTHNYANVQVDRTYQIRYVAYTGFDGTCQKEVTKTITVRASPIAVFTPPLDVCLNGGPVILNTGTASGGTGVYMGPGVTFAGGVYTFNPLAVGVVIGNTNNVTYAVTSPAGCDSALVRPIRVLAPPVVNTFFTVGNLCRINDITFRNTTTNGDGTIVRWIYDWGDGSALQTMTTGADVTHQYATAGPKTVTLTLETGYGCRNIPRTLNITVNALPVPTYTFTNSACLPAATIVFTNTMANQANFNYVWSFELPSTTPANTSVLPNPSHVYTNLGPHSTHLIATNNTTGCKDSTAIIIIDNNTIHPAPVVVFNPIPDVCLNNGTVIINQASETSGIPLNGGAVYSGPGVSLVGANYVFNPLAAGVIVGLNTITVTFTSTFNCPTVRTQSVRVLAKPVVNVFTTVGNKCEQNQTIFHNEITQGAGVVTKWVYDWGDGSALQTELTGADVTHFYTVTNTYPATLYLITDYGCKSDVKPLSVVINPIPKPNFTYSDTVCLPAGKVLFTNTSTNTSSNTYSWIFNNVPPTIKTTVNTDFTYSNIGPHPVKLIATNATTFCRDSITRNVTTIHPAPVAAFDFSVPRVCIGTPVSVLDRSTFADGIANKWEWNWGDGSLATGQSPASKNYGTAQTYNVTLKVTNSFGCFDDSIRAFTVHPFPVVNAGRDSIILEGGNLVLTPTVTGNDLTYLWTGTPAPLNLSSTTVLNPVASPSNDITYTLKATARGGCSATDNVFIKVLKYPVIPNTFTPNNDGVHDFWVIKYLESYPDCRVQVFTRAGQLVFESRRYLKPWNGTAAGASLPFDTYYYIIEPGTGRKPITGYVTIVK